MSAYQWMSTKATIAIAVGFAVLGFLLGRRRYQNRMPAKW